MASIAPADKTDLEALVGELKAFSSGLSPRSRELLRTLLLEFWLNTRNCGTEMLEIVGDDRANAELRLWLAENNIASTSSGADDDGTTGATGTGVR